MIELVNYPRKAKQEPCLLHNNNIY